MRVDLSSKFLPNFFACPQNIADKRVIGKIVQNKDLDSEPSSILVAIRKLHQKLQSLPRVAGIDGISGKRHRVADAIGVAGSDQCSCGIEQHDVAAAGALAIQNCANDGRILLRITSSDLLEGRALQAEFFRRDFIHAHLRRCAPRQFCWDRRW